MRSKERLEFMEAYIEQSYILEMKHLKWWQFSLKRRVKEWRLNELKKLSC